MLDGCGRTINYLRLSVTDLCNYRCRYCMPPEGVAKRDHGDILSLEELADIARAAVRLGVKKIRLTGGEPLVRQGIVELCRQLLDIGAQVKMGDVAATVDGEPMICTLDGVLRGILPEGTPVHKGMKAGDIDPRCAVEHCYTASDKALAVGGGVLEAILHLSGALRHPLVPAEPALYDRLEQQPFREAWDASTLETLF